MDGDPHPDRSRPVYGGRARDWRQSRNPTWQTAVEVIAMGHQFWWEFRYPGLNVVTANELHVPVSDPAHPTPTLIKLLSADTDHSFWVPRLAGKTDLIPNHTNLMWIDPQRDRALSRPVCAVLRNTTRQDAAARLCAVARRISTAGFRDQSQPAQVSDAVSEGRHESSRPLPASIATLWRARRRKDALVRI